MGRTEDKGRRGETEKFQISQELSLAPPQTFSGKGEGVGVIFPSPKELQEMGVNLASYKVFPSPGSSP